MRTIERSCAFKRDYKRVKMMTRYSNKIDLLLSAILSLLLVDQALPESNRDHALSGEWDGYRECHVKPDL